MEQEYTHRELIKDKINCLWRTILITVPCKMPFFRCLSLHVNLGFSYLILASLLTCLKVAFWCTALCHGLNLLLIGATSWHLGNNKPEKNLNKQWNMESSPERLIQLFWYRYWEILQRYEEQSRYSEISLGLQTFFFCVLFIRKIRWERITLCSEDKWENNSL